MREFNIEAAKAVADSVRTSLGPRGLDKMVRGQPAGFDECLITRHRRAALRDLRLQLSHVDLPRGRGAGGGRGRAQATQAPDRSHTCARTNSRARYTHQVAAANGEVLITNDGATILNKMSVQQPAAKMLVELAKSQVGGRAIHRKHT